MNVLYTVPCLRTTIQATYNFPKQLPIAKPFHTWGVHQKLEMTSPYSQSLYKALQYSNFRRVPSPSKISTLPLKKKATLPKQFSDLSSGERSNRNTPVPHQEVTETRLYHIKQCEFSPCVSASIHASLISYSGRKLHRERNHSARRLTGSDSHYCPVQGGCLVTL